tara:strand:- start:300 stop:665 length:366 start_codon:yes stop_codon:yes gene_type:complete
MPLYDRDPNNSNKQTPNTKAKGYRQLAGYSMLPAVDTVQKPPSYVIINQSGSYSFKYRDYTEGRETPFTSSFITGAFVIGTSETAQGVGAGLKLDINPVVWHRTDKTGATGDVTFVYRRNG